MGTTMVVITGINEGVNGDDDDGNKASSDNEGLFK